MLEAYLFCNMCSLKVRCSSADHYGVVCVHELHCLHIVPWTRAVAVKREVTDLLCYSIVGFMYLQTVTFTKFRVSTSNTSPLIHPKDEVRIS